MTRFEEILTARSEDLLKTLYRSASKQDEPAATGLARTRQIAHNLGLTYPQLVCALGFNAHIQELSDVLAVLGFSSYDALARERNLAFVTDIYQQLGVKDVLAIYLHVTHNLPMLEVIQHLLERRLEKLEERIEATVNSVFIERYKKEMRAIYNDGVAQIEFAEKRLSNTHSGFRALLNEVALIVESRLIPVGDIFFRDSILPEEKRRLIIRGLIPRALVEARLADASIPAQERKVLEDQIKLLDA
ncbi:MAG: hypothetical protein H6977_15345 [Gammaproteobacteria bacterium]|nr:hypothetical protein [Gammaproteobacteria bacterium]MCP5201376.1 hypothetical protein [Gammaproteobacteria bacterium]